MKKYLLLAILSICGLCISNDSYAGRRLVQEVVVNTTAKYANGSVGSARASADNNQYIGCYISVTSGGSSSVISCNATNSANVSISCNKSNPSAAMLQAVASVSESSYIYFTLDASGYCSVVQVTNSSSNRPMTP